MISFPTVSASSSSHPDFPRPNRVLVRGVNWLGDAVMTTPALLQLREALPGARIAMLTPSKLADLWRHHPAVDEVLPIAPGTSPWAVGRSLRAHGFEAALILPNSPRSALECLFARIPVRVGFARGWRRFLLSHPVPARPESVAMRKPGVAEIRRRIELGTVGTAFPVTAASHHSLEYLALAKVFGANPAPLAPCLRVTEDEREGVRRKFGLERGVPWVGLNPGAEYGPAKRWPADRFAAAAREVASARGVRWVLLGGAGDRAVTETIGASIPGSLNLAGSTSLRELISVLSEIRVLLTNDSGPMHVAAALGTPVVVPFGSTSPELTGPGLAGDPRHRLLRAGVPCAPCFLRQCPVDFRCMLGIGVDRVVGEILELLSVRG